MDVILLYINGISASSLYTLFNLYNNSWFTFNVSILHNNTQRIQEPINQ